MMRIFTRTLMQLMLLVIGSLVAQTALQAQGRGGGRGGPPLNPKAAAPIDLTGYWVSIVTEDWRYRMVTPAKGDYASVPINADGRKVADAWDPAKDEAAGDQCKSYGAPAVMRVPGRVHITWQNDNTMKVETDAGTQTRLFNFTGSPAGPGGDWQGSSAASWDIIGGGRRGPRRGGLRQGGEAAGPARQLVHKS